MSSLLVSTTTEVPASYSAPIETLPRVSSLSDGLWLIASLSAPLIVWSVKELLQLDIKKRNAQLELEIEKQKLDQQEKVERVEYLEALVKTLMQEIFTLNKAMERYGLLNAKMYEPKQ